MKTIKVKVKLNEDNMPSYECKICPICGHIMGIPDYRNEHCLNCDEPLLIIEEIIK